MARHGMFKRHRVPPDFHCGVHVRGWRAGERLLKKESCGRPGERWVTWAQFHKEEPRSCLDYGLL